MDLIGIIAISFVLFLAALVPPLFKNIYNARRNKKLLREYKLICRQHNELEADKSKSLPDNVISLKAYKKQRYSNI